MLNWIIGGHLIGDFIGSMLGRVYKLLLLPMRLARNESLGTNIAGIVLGIVVAFFFATFCVTMPLAIFRVPDATINPLALMSFLVFSAIPIGIVLFRRVIMARVYSLPEDAPWIRNYADGSQVIQLDMHHEMTSTQTQTPQQHQQPIPVMNQTQPARRFCTKCGCSILASSNFCGGCGAPIR